jgi:selenocysteine lyase/cysteine desulfurase
MKIDDEGATLGRRDFLVRGGLAVAASAALGVLGTEVAHAGAAARSATSWADVKAQFVLAPGLAHMAAFFFSSHPRVVRDALETHRRGLDADPFEYVEANIARLETAVRAAAAAYTGAGPDDIALTDSTTAGLGIVYGGVHLRPDQEILSTTHDHIVTTTACELRSRRSGVTFRRVPLYDDPAQATVAGIVGALIQAVRPQTRVIAVTWVHSGTGVKLPVRALADALAQLNAGRAPADRALLCVDGVHGFGVEDETLPELGCDVFVAGCHKWILGPRGTGLVWARPEIWAQVDAITPSVDPMWRTGPPDSIPAAALLSPGGFHSFEHRWALEPAFRLHLALGKARIAERIRALNGHVRAELARMPRVRLATPRTDELSSGITCLSVDGSSPGQTVARLKAKGIVATVTPAFYRPAYVRIAASLVTLEPDVERTLAAVRAL